MTRWKVKNPEAMHVAAQAIAQHGSLGRALEVARDTRRKIKRSRRGWIINAIFNSDHGMQITHET